MTQEKDKKEMKTFFVVLASAIIATQAEPSEAVERAEEVCPGGSTSIQGGGNAPGDQGEAVNDHTTGGNE